MSDSTDPIAAKYFSEVGKHPLPTIKEERALFTAYKEAQTRAELGRTAHDRSEGARDRIRIGQNIACGYLRFVILQARRRTSDPQLLKDLISQGNVGLMIGVERFGLEFNVRFLTYAASWINVYMQEHLHKLSVVHVPSHTRKEMRRRKVQGGAPAIEEPIIGSLEGINIAAEDDTEEGAKNNECDMFAFMAQADLSRVERIVMVYCFGLRGVELNADDIVQLIYELDGSLFSAESVEGMRKESVKKLKELLDAKGIEQLSDLL